MLNSEDTHIWLYTYFGTFFVKSAYHLPKMSKMLLDRNFGETSNRHNRDIFWKKLWKLPTLMVVKVFIWKTCHNDLPTRANLLINKVLDFDLYPICGLEDVVRALWNCVAVGDLWSVGCREIQKLGG